jgi:hypothetical protein
MRKSVTLLTVVLALVVAGIASAMSATRIPPFPVLPGDWSHAEINVTIAKTPHTLVLDRGQVGLVTATFLRLREQDGSVVTIPVSPGTTRVLIDGARGRLRWLNPTMTAETMRIDGGVAVRIVAQTG